MPPPLRRLPVLGSSPPPDGGEERPPWHWSAIGAVLTFSLWLPFAWMAQALSQRLVARLVPADDPTAIGTWLAASTTIHRAVVMASLLGPAIAAFLAGSGLGGFLVGKFGGRAGAKEAGVGALIAASSAWALVAVRGGLLPSLILWPPVALLGFAAGYLGGRYGVKRR